MRPVALEQMALELVAEELSSRRYVTASRKAVERGIKEFLAWARRHKVDLGGLTRPQLRNYQRMLCKRKSKRTGLPLVASTVNSHLSAVGVLCSCLYRSGILQHNPSQELDWLLPLPSSHKRRPLSRDEIDRFLELIDGESKRDIRDRTLFELIYSSGLRVSEAAGLKVGDLDIPRRLMVVRGKFDRDRVVPVSQVAMDLVTSYLGPRLNNREDWVFPGYSGHLKSTTISERFRTLLRDFNMDKPEISTHSIRHSTATHLLENGASIRHVQELLGHHCIESTVRYTHVMVDRLYQAYRRHHPREQEFYEEPDPKYFARLESLKNRL